MTGADLDEAAVAAAWDRNAALWTEEVRSGFDLYRELYTLPAFLDFMPSIAGKQVIDLGCGEGSNTRRFAQLGGTMTGIDLSPEMIKRARQREEEAPLGITYGSRPSMSVNSGAV
jgi:2-polyprenyl-3-methyl-5-hydroxy-6-metoxy-1,4-benzoquinol methylase